MLVHVSALQCQEKTEQLSESMIVLVALWAVAIALEPFRMLLEQCVVHCALKFSVSGNFSELIGG